MFSLNLTLVAHDTFQKIELKATTYEPLLKQPLECFWCEEEFKTMPKLKVHLQKEWDDLAKKERPYWERKKKAKKEAERKKAERKKVEEKANAGKTAVEEEKEQENEPQDKGEGTSKKRPRSSSTSPEHKRARTTESPLDDD